MTVQKDAIKAGKTIDDKPEVKDDDDIRRWTPDLLSMEWVNQDMITLCPGFKRALTDEQAAAEES